MQNRLEGWEKEIRRSRNFEYSSYQAHLLPSGSTWHWGGRTGLGSKNWFEQLEKVLATFWLWVDDTTRLGVDKGYIHDLQKGLQKQILF